MVLHENHKSPESFNKGTELANWEVLLPARMDTLRSSMWCPRNAFDGGAITKKSVKEFFGMEGSQRVI